MSELTARLVITASADQAVAEIARLQQATHASGAASKAAAAQSAEGQARVGQAAAGTAKAVHDQAATAVAAAERQAAAYLRVAEAYRDSDAAGRTMAARVAAESQVTSQHAEAVERVTAALRNQAAAQDLARLAQQRSDLEAAREAQERLTAAAQNGTRAVQDAARANEVAAIRRRALATATEATAAAIEAEITKIEEATAATQRLAREQRELEALAAARQDLALDQRRAAAAAISDPRARQAAEREIARQEQLNQLQREGTDLSSAYAQERMRLWDESQTARTLAATRAAEAHAAALRAGGVSAGEARQRMLAWQYTLSDTASSLASGMSPLMILAQQGPQVADAYGGIGSVLARVNPLMAVLGATALATAASLAIGMARAEGNARVLAQLESSLRGAGAAAAASQSDLVQWIDELAAAPGVSRKTAGEIVSSWARTREVRPFIGELTGAVADLAAVMGTDAAAAADTLARAVASPGEAIRGTLGDYLRLTTAQVAQAEAAARAGDRATVVATLLKGLGHTSGEANKALTPMQQRFDGLAKAWDRFAEALADSAPVQIALSGLTAVLSVLERIASFDLRRGISAVLQQPPLQAIQARLERERDALAQMEAAAERVHPAMRDHAILPGAGVAAPVDQALDRQRTLVAELEAELQRLESARRDDAAATREQAAAGGPAAEAMARQRAEALDLARSFRDSALARREELDGQRERLERFSRTALDAGDTEGYETARRGLAALEQQYRTTRTAVEQSNFELEQERRVLAAPVQLREALRARLQAEEQARRAGRTELEATTIGLNAYNQALANASAAGSEAVASAERQAAALMRVAAAYAESERAGQAMALRVQAEEQAAAQAGVSVQRLTAALQQQAAARQLVSLSQQRAEAEAELKTQERLLEAARQGAGALQEAARQAEIAALRRKALAVATDETAAAMLAEIEVIERATAATQRLAREQRQVEELRSARQDVDLDARRLQLAQTSDPQARKALERDIERQQQLNRLISDGVDLQSEYARERMQLWDEGAGLREAAQYWDEVRETAADVSKDISGFIVDIWVNAEKGGKSTFQSLWDGIVATGKRAFARLAAQALETQIIMPIVTQVVGSVPSLFGISRPSGAQAGGGAAQSGGGLFGGGGDIFGSLRLPGNGGFDWLSDLSIGGTRLFNSVIPGASVGATATTAGLSTTGSVMTGANGMLTGGGAASSGATAVSGATGMSLGQLGAGAGAALGLVNFAMNPSLGSGVSAAGGLLSAASSFGLIGAWGGPVGIGLALAGSLLGGKGKVKNPSASFDLQLTDEGLKAGNPKSKHMSPDEILALGKSLENPLNKAAKLLGGTFAKLEAGSAPITQLGMGTDARAGTLSVHGFGEIANFKKEEADKAVAELTFRALKNIAMDGLAPEIERARKNSTSTDLAGLMGDIDFVKRFDEILDGVAKGLGDWQAQIRQSAQANAQASIDQITATIARSETLFQGAEDSDQRATATRAALRSSLDIELGLVDGARAPGQIEQQLVAAKAKIEALKPALEELGYTAEEVTWRLEQANRNAIIRAKEAVERAVQDTFGILPGTVQATTAAMRDFQQTLEALRAEASAAGMQSGDVEGEIIGRLNAGYAQSVIARVNPLVAELMQLDQRYDVARQQMRALGGDTGLLEMAYQGDRAEIIERNSAALRETSLALRRLAADLRAFADQLLLDRRLTTLDPGQILAEATRQYEETLAKAQAGDEDARNSLTGKSQALLEAGREYWASSPEYKAIFDRVQADLRALADQAEAQAGVQLQATNTQVTALTAAGNQYTAAVGALTSQQIQAFLQSTAQINGLLTNLTGPPTAGGVNTQGGGPGPAGTAWADPGFAAAANDRLAAADAAYLAANPDVAAAVAAGQFRSAGEHWQQFGVHEGRTYGSNDVRPESSAVAANNNSAFWTVANDNAARGSEASGWRAISYFAAAPDVAAAFRAGAFGDLSAEEAAAKHWEDFGRLEGRNAFATTGSFTVGGRGGVDSQVIPLRLTPGEIVDVRRPYQPTSGGGADLSPLAARLDRVAQLLEELIATQADGSVAITQAVSEAAAVTRTAATEARLASLRPRRVA